MEHFLGFALPGIPYGCTYAIVAVGLVLTYQATGVFNFAFGAQAFAAAFVFTLLTQNEHWSGFPAFVVSVVVMSPLIGLAFDYFLFRHIANSNSMAKVVCSLCLFVGIPSLMPVIFGAQNLDATATIFPFFNPNVVYFTWFETPINGIYLSTVTVTVVVLVALTASCAIRAWGCRCAVRWRAAGWCSSTVSTPVAWSPSPGPRRASWPGWPASSWRPSTVPSRPTTSPPSWWRPLPPPPGACCDRCPSPPGWRC
jgi:branched-subunit amino acid ABC-type transport system permease component